MSLFFGFVPLKTRTRIETRARALKSTMAAANLNQTPTWSERVERVMSDGRWYTMNAIRRELDATDRQGHDCVSAILHKLKRYGYVEKATHPRHAGRAPGWYHDMRGRHADCVVVWRWAGGPYEMTPAARRMVQVRQLRGLPAAWRDLLK